MSFAGSRWCSPAGGRELRLAGSPPGSFNGRAGGPGFSFARPLDRLAGGGEKVDLWAWTGVTTG